jgi:hypothetical protein
VRVPNDYEIANVLAFVNLQSASFNKRGPARLAGESESSTGLLAVGQEGPGLQRDKISTN